jgi:acetyl-CoA synthetase
LHTHQSYPVGHLSTMYWIGLRPGDIHLNISSPGWAKHAWSCFFAPWNAGACVFIYNYARFNGKAMLSVLERCRVTTLCAPPTVWRMLIQEDIAAFRGRLAIRELIGAGEPLNPEIIDRVQAAWGITIRDGFGQTETTAVIGNSPGQPVKPGSMGRPLPGYDVVLLDVDGMPADDGEVSIRLDPRPVGLMKGYLGDTEKNAEVMRDGFYRTGDVGKRDGDGYITYVGRADDVFKASDYRISPFELESIAIEHPAIGEAAVVPSPDPLRLAVPKCFVSLRQGYTASPELAADVFAFLRKRLAPYKRIAEWMLKGLKAADDAKLHTSIREQVFDLTVVGFQKSDRIARDLRLCHGLSFPVLIDWETRPPVYLLKSRAMANDPAIAAVARILCMGAPDRLCVWGVIELRR